MKVIFLDMDGVMNDRQHLWDVHKSPNKYTTIQEGDIMMVDPRCVVHLNRIIEETGAKVVMSSSWRVHYGEVKEFQELYDAVGIKGEALGRTGRENTRAEEIQVWLNEHPKVESFVVLDDGPDRIPWCAETQPELFPHFVKTRWNPEDGRGGLHEEHVLKAIEILNGVSD